MRTRLLLHPILMSRTGKIILFLYFSIGAGVSWFFFKSFHNILDEANMTPSILKEGLPPLIVFFMNPFVYIPIIVGGILLAASYTANRVVGPAQRIDLWLKCWIAGQNLSPLRARNNDVYATFIELLNALYLKSKRDKETRKKN
ncbi:MAG: hypothetical protein KCHDKBKB_00527 [Elusimicrobia bacterium]|nr:hypothetical protein [Elusimicrobiota bacterium]